jgi:hypothetical protein
MMMMIIIIIPSDRTCIIVAIYDKIKSDHSPFITLMPKFDLTFKILPSTVPKETYNSNVISLTFAVKLNKTE